MDKMGWVVSLGVVQALLCVQGAGTAQAEGLLEPEDYMAFFEPAEVADGSEFLGPVDYTALFEPAEVADESQSLAPEDLAAFFEPAGVADESLLEPADVEPLPLVLPQSVSCIEGQVLEKVEHLTHGGECSWLDPYYRDADGYDCYVVDEQSVPLGSSQTMECHQTFECTKLIYHISQFQQGSSTTGGQCAFGPPGLIGD